MITGKIAEKYARALYLAAKSTHSEKQMLQHLEGLATVIQSSRLMEVFASPQIHQAQKIELIKKTLANVLDKDVFSFLLLLLKKKRFNLLPAIIELFKEKFDENHAIVNMHLTTATPISERVKERLKKSLDSIHKKTTLLSTDVDASLLGGGILKTGCQMIDFSIKSKLNRLKDELLSINV